MLNRPFPFDVSVSHPKFKNEVLREDWSGIHPVNFLNFRVMGKMKGGVTSVHPLILKNFKIKGNLSLAILDLTEIENQKMKDKRKYTPLPKYPGAEFDCTVVVDQSIKVGEILQSLKKLKFKEITESKIVDIFGREDGQKAVTLRTFFLDRNKTLDGDYLKNMEDEIVKKLNQSGYPLKI